MIKIGVKDIYYSIHKSISSPNSLSPDLSVIEGNNVNENCCPPCCSCSNASSGTDEILCSIPISILRNIYEFIMALFFNYAMVFMQANYSEFLFL